jgi:hypothetical protein
MSDMAAREAAARAMFDARTIELDQDGRDTWDGLPEEWREEWREGANAAIEAYLATLLGLTEQRLGSVIWRAPRDDEGTISATGANHVARSILADLGIAAPSGSLPVGDS